MPFHTVDGEAIKAGKVTDVYFARTVEILRAGEDGVHEVGRRDEHNFG